MKEEIWVVTYHFKGDRIISKLFTSIYEAREDMKNTTSTEETIYISLNDVQPRMGSVNRKLIDVFESKRKEWAV